jgi:hypothetical protein
MKSRDERRADFERREADRKALYASRMAAIKEKDDAWKAQRAAAREPLEAERDCKDAARLGAPSMLSEMGFENPTAMPFAVLDAVQRRRAKNRLRKRGLL